MKLPPLFLHSPLFMFSNVAELKRALEGEIDNYEIEQIDLLAEKGLPPIVSRSSLAVMFGVSPGLIWSFVQRPKRHYRVFEIPKGSGVRTIQAPRVALKIVQKWIAVQLERVYVAPNHVYGFVQGRSHIKAALVHQGAKWIFSVDIKDFFQSTPQELVESTLRNLGYNNEGAEIIAGLCCLVSFKACRKDGSASMLYKGLSQGAPSSPVLSNLCFQVLDECLLALSVKYGVKLTRYADDIVFSGGADFPLPLKDEVLALFEVGCWKLAEQKTELLVWPKQRLKVHGLLVHGDRVRLTKGYRNRIRGFQYMLSRDKVRPDDVNRLQGHLNYGRMVDRIVEESI